MFPLRDAVIGVSLAECLNSVANMKQIQPPPRGQLCKLLWELGGDYLQITALGTTPGLFAFNLSWGKFKRRKEECRLAGRHFDTVTLDGKDARTHASCRLMQGSEFCRLFSCISPVL